MPLRARRAKPKLSALRMRRQIIHALYNLEAEQPTQLISDGEMSAVTPSIRTCITVSPPRKVNIPVEFMVRFLFREIHYPAVYVTRCGCVSSARHWSLALV